MVEEFCKDIVKGVRRTHLLKKIGSISGKAIFRECSLSFSKGAAHTLTISVLYFCSTTTEFRDRFFCSYLPWKACAIRQVYEHGSCVFSDNCRRLVVEQSESCKAHGHSVLVTCLDYVVVSYRTTRLCNVLNTGLLCTLNIIAKWEKRVRTKCNILHAV